MSDNTTYRLRERARRLRHDARATARATKYAIHAL